VRKVIVTLLMFQIAATAHAGVDELLWLAGHWCGTHRGVLSEEVWLPPRAGSLLGMHRDSKAGMFMGFEFFRIVEEGTDLVYWTQPNGQPALAFRAKAISRNSVAFVNAAHDFPKRISYRRIDANTLLARIDDGTDDGKRMEWTWRDDCPQSQ